MLHSLPKNEFGFVNGLILQPKPNEDSSFQSWECNDNNMIFLLLNSVSKEINAVSFTVI